MNATWRRCLRGATLLMLPTLAALPSKVRAQQTTPPATLTLDEAISLARRNNPDYRILANDANVADWNYAESLAALLPGISIGSGYTYQAAGRPQAFGNFTAEDLGISQTPASYFSSYGINAGMQLSGQTLFQIKQQKANRIATDAQIAAAGFSLVADVSREYLTALRSKETIRLSTQELQSARESLKQTSARFEAGAGTKIDVAQAEVAVGRAEVALIQAENLHETDKLRLLQRIGVNVDRQVELTSSLQLFDPTWTREELVAIAMQSHPQLAAARASEAASKAAASSNKMLYLPTLSLGGNWSGSAREIGSQSTVLESAKNSIENQRDNCIEGNRFRALLGDPAQDCSKFVFTPDIGQKALDANNVFPFTWAGSPPSFSLRISLPIFDGLSRERQVQQARAQADDAMHRRRAAELQQQTMVGVAYLNLKTAQRSVAIEQRNAETAAEQLELARERFRLGAGTFVELTQAETVKARADRDHVNAIYQFHENVAALEAAVGRPLRR